MRKDPQRACCSRCHRSEENRCVRNSRIGPTQVEDKASHQGGQTRGLWQSCHGQSEASSKGRQGLPRCSLKAVHLSSRSRVFVNVCGQLFSSWSSTVGFLRGDLLWMCICVGEVGTD